MEWRRFLKRLGLIALAAYIFFGAYHVVLESLGLIEGDGVRWLLVLVVGTFSYEGSTIEDAHYGVLRDVAYVYYLIFTL